MILEEGKSELEPTYSISEDFDDDDYDHQLMKSEGVKELGRVSVSGRKYRSFSKTFCNISDLPTFRKSIPEHAQHIMQHLQPPQACV